MVRIKIMNRTRLLRLNKLATDSGYNRTLFQEKIEQLDPDTLVPIEWSIPEADGRIMRCCIVLPKDPKADIRSGNVEVITAMLDIPIREYNELVSVIVDNVSKTVVAS